MYRLSYLTWPKTLALALVGPLLAASIFAASRTVENDSVLGVALVYQKIHHLAPLSVPAAPGPSRLLAANGQLLATFTYENRQPVSLDKVSAWVPKALIAEEDRTFYTNDGLDARSIIRAALNNLLGRPIQGASTITEQYVKNLVAISTNTPPQDTISRKLSDLIYANQLTRSFTKAQILAGYLNTVYFGHGAYGIAAGAQTYFSRPARELTLTQAALLVALVRSPAYYDPVANPSNALAERNHVLYSMYTTHIISRSKYETASASSLGLRMSNPPATNCVSSSVPYYCTTLWYQLLDDPALGPTSQARADELYSGNLTIHSTLDPTYEAYATAAATSVISYQNPVGTALVSIDPHTGDVLAMAENRHYGLNTKLNQTEVNYAVSPSPVGSTMKAFTLATALSQHISPDTILPAGATYHSPTLKNPPGGYFTNADPYDPTNINLAQATAYSVNTAFVQLEQKIGVLPIARTAYAMGLRSLALSGPSSPRPNEGSFTLGARAFSPLEMASAYASLASGGLYCVPRMISSITFSNTHTVYEPPRCRRVLSPSIAYAVTSLLEGPVSYGTGTSAQVPGYQIAGKTGTTQNYGSAWFIGYTPSIVTASWVGNPLGPSHPLLSVAGVSPVYGGTIPASMFHYAMAKMLSGSYPQPLLTTPAAALTSTTVLPYLIGVPGTLAAARAASLGLKLIGPTPSVVSATLPAAGTPVSPGATLRLLGPS